jgi:transcription antitermination factor NusG
VSGVADEAVESEQLPASDDLRKWVVVHTRPRCEKKVQEASIRQGLTAFLPLQQRTHHYGSRVRTFASPLFPGYAFCLADAQGRQWLGQNRYTANVLAVSDQELLLIQLRQIQAALSAGHLMEVLPYLETGRRVRVVAGPLRGAEGLIVRIKGQDRVVLNVDMIRESVAVEVDTSLLAPI